MAKLLYTSFLASASGRLAGSSFAGKVVRTRSNFKIRKSAGSTYYRNTYLYIVSLWRTLTVAQRNSWINLCKQKQVFGSAFSPGHQTPFFLFVFCNYYRTLNFQGLSLTAPTPTFSPVLTRFLITPRTSTSQLLISVSGTGFTPQGFVNYYLSPPYPFGKTAYKRNLRLLQFNSFGGTGTGDFASLYISVFGRLPYIGEVIYGGIRMFDSEYLQPMKMLVAKATAF